MWRKAAKVNHGTNQRNHQHVHPLETRPNLRHLREEVGIILLLRRRTPVHVDTEHVRQDCHADVEREAAKEDYEERHPLEVFEQRLQQAHLAEAIPQQRKGDIGHEVEDKNERDEDCES